MKLGTDNETDREINGSGNHECDLPVVHTPGSRNGHGALQTAQPRLAGGMNIEHASGSRNIRSGILEEIVVRSDTV